ncbi:ATP-binding cassette domain-containing protein ['Camptotheca acuminata' phytoplasma]|uniref:ATP-binding cassette domain-containing protein n=1 Tax='Camptotheca acuminata' phytoplasma TaxID=3239192 RepID=UPI00351A58B2
MIVIKNLGFNYKNKKIFNNLNLEILIGNWISIIGKNGSGKSTLAKILIGLLKQNEGQIFIDGRELIEDNLSEIRSLMGIVFQNPDYQFVGLDVKSDIAFGLENQLLSRKEMQKRIEKYSRMMNINHLLDKKPQDLSGGQKQKVAITSVLVMEPKIIIFDEPTSFLDPQGAKEIFDIIYNISKEQNKILITITHDLNFALKSDKILLLEEGNLEQYWPLELLENYDFAQKYFNYLPLSMKINYELQKRLDSKDINKEFFNKLKDALWEYTLKM